MHTFPKINAREEVFALMVKSFYVLLDDMALKKG
jgi:hypothetical protein